MSYCDIHYPKDDRCNDYISHTRQDLGVDDALGAIFLQKCGGCKEYTNYRTNNTMTICQKSDNYCAPNMKDNKMECGKNASDDCKFGAKVINKRSENQQKYNCTEQSSDQCDELAKEDCEPSGLFATLGLTQACPK